MQRKNIILIIKIVLWIAGLYLSAYYSFHTLYFIFSGMYLMFTNLGTRKKGTLSAYSVFNQNFERLQGTMDGMSLFKGGIQEDAPKLVLEKMKITQNQEFQASREEYFKNESKYSNKPCFCGSSAKFKKCCLVAERKKAEEERLQRIKSIKKE